MSSANSQQENALPRLAEPFEPTPPTGDVTPHASATSSGQVDDNTEAGTRKKRTLFGFGKKKSGDDSAPSTKSPPPASTSEPSRKAASPIQIDRPTPTMLPSTPRLASPAGSQIFERDVQESAAVLPNSPAIPSHITTEDLIPSVLDASSEAITDKRIDPDSVEIITHASHQPAAVTVTGAPLSPPSDSFHAGSWADDLASFAERDHNNTLGGGGGPDSASNYGSLDTTDVRRLSFISFADVVQAEQHLPAASVSGGHRDSMHLSGLVAANRSPSPIRSPVSVASSGPVGTSPPASKSGSAKGEMSPSRKPSAPLQGQGQSLHVPAGQHGELNIETMSQALNRTGSGDLVGGVGRSQPTSPIEGPVA